MKDDRLILGIDIGTTKAAAVIINTDRQLLGSARIQHDANIPGHPGFAEQDISVLFDAVRTVVCQLPEKLRTSVKAVGVTGQMHGIALTDENTTPITPLINWQDGRCDKDFLKKLNAATGYQLKTGFGCATLAWLNQNVKLPSNTTGCATIHDLLVAKLCELKKPVTDPTDAASWGLFDLHRLQWDTDAVKSAGISCNILPKVLPCSWLAGKTTKTQAEYFGIPSAIPVAVAIGDDQASLLATITEPEKQLALTLGTGGQVSAILPPAARSAEFPPDASYEYRPYPGKRFTIVAASLCGGSAWAWLVDNIQNWFAELNQPCPPKEQIYNRLNELGLKTKTKLTIKPNFIGERYAPELRGSIAGIDMENFDLSNIATALAKGIVENLKQMLPQQALFGRAEIVGSGNALGRNQLLQSMVEEVFNLPLKVHPGREETAVGAAINAASLI